MGGGLSPCQIVTGITGNCNKHYRLQFGDYAQVHEAHYNTMQEQATRAVSLRPTGNTQGAYLFMITATGIIPN